MLNRTRIAKAEVAISSRVRSGTRYPASFPAEGRQFFEQRGDKRIEEWSVEDQKEGHRIIKSYAETIGWKRFLAMSPKKSDLMLFIAGFLAVENRRLVAEEHERERVRLEQSCGK